MRHEEEMKNEEALRGEEQEEVKTGENGGTVDNSDNKSTLALFDKLQAREDKELDDSVSSVMSSNSFRTSTTRK